MILRRVVRLAPAALGGLVALTFSVGPSVAQSGFEITAAEAEANATFLRVEDPAYFVDDTIFAPPVVTSSYAFSKIDRAELSTARAASAYSEYFNLLGAFPELGPAVLPPDLQFIFFALLEFYPPGLAEDVANVSQASVQGRPTQSDEATVSSGGVGEGGVMRASIEEGPVAAARSAYASFPTSSLASAGSADSHTTVRTVAAGRQATATSVLRDISIGGIIEIDSIQVTATALADGAQGLAEANVVIDGVTVADVPAVIDHEGIRVADSVAPVSAALLNQALETLGVTVAGPGEVVTQPGGEEARASATGPRIRYHNAQDQVVILTLGRAVAESDRAEFDFASPPPPPPLPPPSTEAPTSGPISGPVTIPTSPPAPGPSVPGPVVDEPPAPDDPTAYALDRELLILARDGMPLGILDLYTVLVICALVLGGWGAMRPWREP